MEDVSQGTEADERQFLSRSHLGCHDNIYLQVINQDAFKGGQDGKKRVDQKLGSLEACAFLQLRILATSSGNWAKVSKPKSYR